MDDIVIQENIEENDDPDNYIINILDDDDDDIQEIIEIDNDPFEKKM